MKPPKTYPINEIFQSIQGEGLWAGSSVCFIRFSGCNLKCTWCDTDHSDVINMTAQEIVDALHASNPYTTAHPIRIVLTGGEPTIHKLVYLLKHLKAVLDNPLIHIETNGTSRNVEDWYNKDLIDWITLSPKPDFGKTVLEIAHEIKLIVDKDTQESTLIEWEDKVRSLYKLDEPPYLYIQPCDPHDETQYQENLSRALELIQRRPKWRLSCQIHKLLNLQ